MTLYEITKGCVKDDSGKLADPFDYDSGVTAAIKRYSKHRPGLAVADLPGNGTHDLDLPSDWCAGFSALTGIEYPIGAVPATLLDADLWQLYRSPSGQKLRILQPVLTVSEALRCEYTVLHTEATIPEADLEAVANLAASFCLRQLAAAYGQSGDSTIQADVVNYRSKTDEFRRLADSFEGLYKNHLGLKDADTVPAGSVTARPPETNRVRLTRR